MTDPQQSANKDVDWMREALTLAEQAAKEGEVPVGAVVVLNGHVIGRGFNRPISTCDPSAHAEIVALRDAAKNIQNYRLNDATLYVTLEPCSMCAGAMVHSRIRHLVYGATESKAGVVNSHGEFFKQPFLNHQLTVTAGVLKNESQVLLKRFFKQRRAAKKFVSKV